MNVVSEPDKPSRSTAVTRDPRRRGRNLGLILAMMVAVAVIDQVVKQIMVTNLQEGVPVNVIGEFFQLFLLYNPGAAFGMGQDSTWLFTTIQLAFVIGTTVAAFFLRDRPTSAGLALIGGGALGNLIDRLVREPGFYFGHVVDYISIGDFAIFNLADASINIGVVVFVIAILTEERRLKKEYEHDDA